MDLRDYLRVFRRRWRLLVACVLLGAAGAAAFVLLATPRYTANTQLFVATNGTPTVSDLVQGSTFGTQEVQSLALIVNSREVTAPIARRLADGLTAGDISTNVTATAPLNTAILDLSYTDTSAQRAADVANTLSVHFAHYAETLNTAAGSNSPVKVTVVRPAAVPTVPSSPRKQLDLALGLVIGLVAGVGGSVLRETLDRSITSPEQIDELVDLPVLGAIAHDPEASSRPLVVLGNPRSTRAEAFRQLRTNLRFIDPDHRPRSLAITSSVPGEGKTTTAVNLAIALADAGQRVVLIEGDLRRPKAANYLGLEGAVGLTDVLVGGVPLREAMQLWGQQRQLHFLASGALPPNPSELLASQGMQKMLRALEANFDIVLIDSPPLLPVTDAVLLSNAADGALVVVRYGKTRREQVTRAVDSLRTAHADVHGVVLTFTPTRGPDAYYYGYGYRYDPARGRHRAQEMRPVVLPDSVSPSLPSVEPAGVSREPAAARRPRPATTTRRAPNGTAAPAARPARSAGHGDAGADAAPNGTRPTIVPGGNGARANGSVGHEPSASERLRGGDAPVEPARGAERPTGNREA